MSAVSTANVLVDALPYIRRFAGKTVVVKYGGNALAGTGEAEALASLAEDLVLMNTVGIRTVVVHGGGPQINEMLSRLGIESHFSNGLRVTDQATMEVVRMVLNGHVNPSIVTALNRFGNVAVGVSGEAARTLEVVARDPELGLVGDVSLVRPALIEGLLDDGLIPVVSTVGVDAGGRAHNVNADTAAGAIAGALVAEKIIYLTDVPGLRSGRSGDGEVISSLSCDGLRELLTDGTVSGGMIPKVNSILSALGAGVRSAHILDGRVPHALLLELFTTEGVGTMVTGED